MGIVSLPHQWKPLPEREGKAERRCERCGINDRLVGLRMQVYWPCILAQESWSLADLRAALIASSVQIAIIDRIVVGDEDGRHRVGVRIVGEYGLDLHPKLPPRIGEGRAIQDFFAWMRDQRFDLTNDPVLKAADRQSTVE